MRLKRRAYQRPSAGTRYNPEASRTQRRSFRTQASASCSKRAHRCRFCRRAANPADSTNTAARCKRPESGRCTNARTARSRLVSANTTLQETARRRSAKSVSCASSQRRLIYPPQHLPSYSLFGGSCGWSCLASCALSGVLGAISCEMRISSRTLVRCVYTEASSIERMILCTSS